MTALGFCQEIKFREQPIYICALLPQRETPKEAAFRTMYLPAANFDGRTPSQTVRQQASQPGCQQASQPPRVEKEGAENVSLNDIMYIYIYNSIRDWAA
jgi:hypothetical protein